MRTTLSRCGKWVGEARVTLGPLKCRSGQPVEWCAHECMPRIGRSRICAQTPHSLLLWSLNEEVPLW